MDHVPMFAWSMLIASSLWLLSLPVLLANLLLIYLDHRLGRPSDFGVALNQWPQVEWVIQQPQVFVLAIPVLGIVGDIVATLAGVRQSKRGVMLAGIGAFGILAFGAWAQPFFNDEVTTQWLYVGMGFAILLPMFAVMGGWAMTMRDGTFVFNAPMVGALLAGVPLLLAGVASALYVIEPLDLQQSPYTQYGVLSLVVGAVAVAGAAGLAYWGPKIWGRTPSNGVALLAVASAFAGSCLAGLAFVVNGFVAEPDEVADAADVLNGAAAAGLALLALGVLLTIVSLLGRSSAPGDDPWHGQTLEWATSSPPPLGNFGTLAEVTSAEPLLDVREPSGAGAG
jgi:heme/copper-type cytochrome/quinol oxidase subunit 1